MHQRVFLIDSDGQGREIEAEDAMRSVHASANTAIVRFRDRADLEVGYHVLTKMPRLIADLRAAKRETRIAAMVETFLDADPFDAVEALIDADNAEMRADFLRLHPVLDSAAVHARAGHAGRNTSQTAAAWKRSGRIFSLPLRGREAFPVFQFDADGQPLPLLKPVLASLPPDLSAWQRAFWLVSPADELEGRTHIDLIRVGDGRAVEAAAQAGRLPVG